MQPPENKFHTWQDHCPSLTARNKKHRTRPSRECRSTGTRALRRSRRDGGDFPDASGPRAVFRAPAEHADMPDTAARDVRGRRCGRGPAAHAAGPPRPNGRRSAGDRRGRRSDTVAEAARPAPAVCGAHVAVRGGAPGQQEIAVEAPPGEAVAPARRPNARTLVTDAGAGRFPPQAKTIAGRSDRVALPEHRAFGEVVGGRWPRPCSEPSPRSPERVGSGRPGAGGMGRPAGAGDRFQPSPEALERHRAGTESG